MAVSEKVKNFLDWFEHGKTLVELLFAIGGGKVLEVVLRQSTKIPSLWMTPIWLLSSAGLLAVVLMVFKPKGDQSQSTTQTTSTRTGLLLAITVVLAVLVYSSFAFPTSKTETTTKTTLDNIDSRVLEVLTRYECGPMLDSDADSKFVYNGTYHGRMVKIRRKNNPRETGFLIFTTALFTPDALAAWQKKKEPEKKKIFHEVNLYLIQRHMELWNLADPQRENWNIKAEVPITETTGDKEIMNALSEIRSGMALMREMLVPQSTPETARPLLAHQK